MRKDGEEEGVGLMQPIVAIGLCVGFVLLTYLVYTGRPLCRGGVCIIFGEYRNLVSGVMAIVSADMVYTLLWTLFARSISSRVLLTFFVFSFISFGILFSMQWWGEINSQAAPSQEGDWLVYHMIIFWAILIFWIFFRMFFGRAQFRCFSRNRTSPRFSPESPSMKSKDLTETRQEK